MKKQYRIGRKEGSSAPQEQDVSRYKDVGKLMYAYEQATRPLYKRPLYKDPKAFVAILIIVLLAILLADVADREPSDPDPIPPAVEGQ